jgi:VWFA-related protein
MTAILCFPTSPLRPFAAASLAACLFIPAAQAQNAPPPATPLAQSPAAPAQQSQGPDLTTTVNEVSLDFVAHDKRNNPILDLKPEDVAVSDNGTPVKLNGMHLIQGDAAQARGHLVTFVFDRFSGMLAKTAQTLAVKVLKNFPGNGYSISVLDLGNRLRLIHGFTDDRHESENAIALATQSSAVSTHSDYNLTVGITIDKAEDLRSKAAMQSEKDLVSIARTGADSSGAHVSPEQRTQSQSLLKALEDTHTIAHDQHSPVALAALLAIIKSQEKISARKAIVYFTTNRQMDTAAKNMLKTIEAAASRSGVTIYTFDLDALNAGAQYQMENAIGNAKPPFEAGNVALGCGTGGCTTVTLSQQQGPGPIAGDPSASGPNWTSKQDVQVMTDWHRQSGDYNMFAAKSPMAEVATNTGGLYIDAQVNIKKPLDRMAEDMSTYYVASYALPTQEYDGSFHTIGLKTVRSGINVQYKTGYYALAPGADGSIRPFEAPLLKLFADSALPTAIQFHAAILRFGDLVDGNTSTAAVEIPLTAIETKEDVHTNLYSAHVIVAGQIRDKSGTVIEHFGEDISKRGALEQLDRDQLDRGNTATIELHRHFATTPGDYTLEVAVSDELGNKTGAQRIPFTIPPAATTAAISDIALVRKMDRIHDEDDDPAEPLRYDKDAVTPNLTGELAQNTKGLSLFFILHPDPAVKDAPMLEMQVVHNGAEGRRIPLPIKMSSDGAALPYLASFGNAALTPGDYTVKAFFNQGGKSVQQQIAFHVVGDAVAASASTPAKVDVSLTSADAAPHAANALAITAATSSVPALGATEAHQLLEDARQAALDYGQSLPNFMCIEVTNRSVDAGGSGRWKLQDTLIELLRYREKTETRNTLSVNGKDSSVDRAGMKGASSTGEFGGVLKSVFDPRSKAEFNWKETDELNGTPVQVYAYSVAQPNSMFSVVGADGRSITVSFHGQVFVDTATRRARRVTLIADDMPKAFSTRGTSIGVDYDYVSINSHDYLMPISAEMRLIKGRRGAMLNTMEFRDYKRFGSNLRIVGMSESDPGAQQPVPPADAKPAPPIPPQ